MLKLRSRIWPSTKILDDQKTLGASRKTGVEGGGSGKDLRLPTLVRVVLIALLLLQRQTPADQVLVLQIFA